MRRPAGLASTPPEDGRDDDVEADERNSVDRVGTAGAYITATAQHVRANQGYGAFQRRNLGFWLWSSPAAAFASATLQASLTSAT